MSTNPKSLVNRYGTRLRIGDRVSVAHPRGGRDMDSVAGFGTTGAFVRAYGKRVVLASGATCSVDDCEVIS